MSTNNRFKVSDLDYNQIRQNLKTFLSGQSQFSDYDFDGSALATIVDLLAYNTHYNALYTNLAVNEMFLDSASKRESLVSIANNFGYTPRSAKTATATVNVTNTDIATTAQTKYISKWSAFSSVIDGTTYNFWTLDDFAATKNGPTYLFENVKLYEGLPQTQLFVCTELNQSFVLPNANIDLDTLSITVQQTGERPDYEKYIRATDVLDLKADSKIYFVKELEDGTYRISFGSSGLGKSISTGNIITVKYLVSNRTGGNGATIFTYTGNQLAGTNSVVTIQSAYGGMEKESSDEIRFNVSQTFFDQNRTVTPGDYREIIKRQYSNIDSVNVWGGEDNDPPIYGKVFIAAKPINALYLTPSEKTYIKQTILAPRGIVSITPEFVDPTYVELEINSTVYFNKNTTTRSSDDIKASVIDAITSYNDVNLKKFGGIFRMSKFAAAIDGVDQSILSNITSFKLYVEMTPKFGATAEYKFNLANPIYSEGVPEEAFYSTGFYIDNTSDVYHMDDDGVGNIRLIRFIADTNKKVIVNPKIGTIDYAKGLIRVLNLRIVNLADLNFYFIVKTSSFDVVPVRNQIITIPSNRITVNTIENSSDASANYRFTTSRN